MKITVAICTWNRSALLDQTLEQLTRLEIPSGVTWELVVVNNRSTDSTPAVLERYQSRLPLVAIDEPIPGHCQARNTALNHAQGELVVWTDDDVLVEPDWLAHYAAAAQRWPDAAFLGGTVDPLFATPPPAWVLANLPLLRGAYALAQLGPEERRLEPGELPFGANMALRPERLGTERFDTRIGLKQNDQVRGDETDLFRRLIRRGEYGVWVAQARVRHYVPAERLRPRFVWDYNVGFGRGAARLEAWPPGRVVLGAPLWMQRKRLTGQLRAWRRWAGGRHDWLLPYMEAARLTGQLQELRSRRAAAPSQAVPAGEPCEAVCR